MNSPAIRPYEIKSEDCESQDQADRQTKKVGNTKIDEETTRDELALTPMYYHDGGGLFAEDVGQHMAVLPEVVTPTQEITIDDIQVGDPGIYLLKRVTPYLLRRVGQFVTSTWEELTRSHNGSDR